MSTICAAYAIVLFPNTLSLRTLKANDFVRLKYKSHDLVAIKNNEMQRRQRAWCFFLFCLFNLICYLCNDIVTQVRGTMAEQTTTPYVCHIFVCTYDRGGEKKSCGDEEGVELRAVLKTEVGSR